MTDAEFALEHAVKMAAARGMGETTEEILEAAKAFLGFMASASDPANEVEGTSPLVAFAESELARIVVDEDDDGMQAEINKHIIAMVRMFADEGHSGSTAPYTINILQKLLRFEPLGPLTGEDAEWIEVAEGQWQNKRCSHVFKDADGRAYDIDGRVFVEPGGSAFTSRASRVFVTFPYTPSRQEILVTEAGEPIEGPSMAQLEEAAQ